MFEILKLNIIQYSLDLGTVNGMMVNKTYIKIIMKYL